MKVYEDISLLLEKKLPELVAGVNKWGLGHYVHARSPPTVNITSVVIIRHLVVHLTQFDPRDVVRHYASSTRLVLLSVVGG